MNHQFSIRILAILASACASALADTDSSPFEDLAEPLKNEQRRTEVEQDRVRSSALFSYGRMLFQRREFPEALRYYQRAVRYDSAAATILQDIVALAFQLQRNDEGIRYALLAAEKNTQDPVAITQLAAFLTKQQDYQRALKLHEKSVAISAKLEDKTEIPFQRLDMARLYFLTEDFEKSAECFTEVMEALEFPEKYGLNETQVKRLSESPQQTIGLFGEALFHIGRLDEALAMFQKAHADGADETLLSFRLAKIHFKNGKSAKAMEQLENYFAAHPTPGTNAPYQLFADLLTQNNQEESQVAEQLITKLEHLLESTPNNSVLAYFLAKQLIANDRVDQAKTIYLKLVDSELSAGALQTLVTIHLQQQDTHGLLSVLRQTIQKTGSLDFVQDQIQPLIEQPEKLEPFFEHLKNSSKNDDPTADAATAISVGLLAIQAQRFDLAEEMFLIALDRNKDSAIQTLTTWGLRLFAADQPDRAADIFQRAIDCDVEENNVAVLLYYQSAALEFSGKTDKAVDKARAAFALQPESPQLSNRIAWILYHAKRYQAAENEYEQVLRTFDKNHGSSDVRTHLRETRLVLSAICAQQERWNEAEEWLEQVLDEFPEDIGAMNDLGYLWADQGKRLNRALQMIQRAVASEPDNPAYRDSLGWVYFRLGEFPSAIRELEKACATEIPDAIILDHLGDAYQAANHPQKAILAWKRAIDGFTDSTNPNWLEKVKIKIRQFDSK